MRKPAANNAFLGTGWGFPPTFVPGTGQAVMVSAEEDIRESLMILLHTRPGERVMQPLYGCGIYRYAFAPMDTNLPYLLRDEISQAILFFEPRVILDDINVDIEPPPENGRLKIEVIYTIRATNTRSNIVFPFYHAEGTLLGDADSVPFPDAG